MWFKCLSLVIGIALIGKATIGLAARVRFYAARRRQYDSAALPIKLLAAPTIVGALTFIAWYATIFHYRPSGWVVTGFLTAIFCLAVDHLFRWNGHRRMMRKVVANPNIWVVDCVLLSVGAGFVALALFRFA